MSSVKIRNLFIFTITSVWSLSALANLSGIVPKVTVQPGALYQSRLFGRMLFTTAKWGTINYFIHESFLGQDLPPEAWQERFAVRLSQRDDGSYDIYRLISPNGNRDGKTLLEGSFVRNESDHTAVLEYKNVEDDSWVRMVFSNTRTTPPKTDAEKEGWRLSVIITVTDGAPDRGRQRLKIEDEFKWLDLATTPVVVERVFNDRRPTID